MLFILVWFVFCFLDSALLSESYIRHSQYLMFRDANRVEVVDKLPAMSKDLASYFHHGAFPRKLGYS